MKKVFFAMAIAGTIMATQATAQGLLGKIKAKTESGGGDEATTTVTDEWGLSGSYTFSTPWEMSGKKQKSAVIEFVREENGVIVNRLTLTIGKGGDKNKFALDEKLMNKTQIKLFKGGIYTPNYMEFEIMQLDNGILFLNCTGQKGYVVLAKNADDLKNWDEETGLAKFDANKKKVSATANAGLRKKLEDKYPAYKENVGKIVFAARTNTFEHNQGSDIAGEDKSNFITEWLTGNGLAMRGYFEKLFSEVCGACDEKINYVFEMGKHKIDWMMLRSSASAFSKMFVPSTGGSQLMTNGVWLWDGIDYNRALVMAIHKNISDGSLKDGAKMNLKVTAYTYSDKTNGTKLAEGNLSIKYDATNSAWTGRYNAFKDAVE